MLLLFFINPTCMVILYPSLHKTSHNIIISSKKNYHSIISSSCYFSFKVRLKLRKQFQNSSKRCSNNFINQNRIKTMCAVLHFSPWPGNLARLGNSHQKHLKNPIFDPNRLKIVAQTLSTDNTSIRNN
jgi:hypothetical protein